MSLEFVINGEPPVGAWEKPGPLQLHAPHAPNGGDLSRPDGPLGGAFLMTTASWPWLIIVPILILPMLKRRGIDVVFRLHQQRKCDFRCGRRLGREDQIVTWTRPGRPAWMDEATYEQVPETLEVRQLRVRVQTRGFRTRSCRTSRVSGTCSYVASSIQAGRLGRVQVTIWSSRPRRRPHRKSHFRC